VSGNFVQQGADYVCIKRHGAYRGHITPDGLTEEDEAEVSY